MNSATQTETPTLMTYKEAAHLLGLSRSSIYRLIEREALTVVRPLPGTPRIRRADLEAYAADLK